MFSRYRRRFVSIVVSVVLIAVGLTQLAAHAAGAVVGVAPTPDGSGYWTVTADGVVNASGSAVWYADMAGKHLNTPMVGIAATPSGHGYWLLAGDGGVFSYGDAQFFGSTGSNKLNKPVVGMAATATGHGYWLVATDGGIFAFGDARFYGSMGGSPLNKPVVGMAATPTGLGYWLVASDGGIFAYGDAQFFGSTGSIKLNKPVVGMAATGSGEGYWLVASDGGIFAYGDAQFFGRPEATALGIVRNTTGYTVLLASGAPVAYGPSGTGSTTTTTTTPGSTTTTTVANNGTVAGQSSLICNQPAQLTSPWTYHALASGSQQYTVAQYQALSGYGTTLPPLPSYISGQGSTAPAAVIFAPGAATAQPAYMYPATPLLYFFEGGNYGHLSLSAVNGDMFIGGSTTGFGLPKFDNGGSAEGISAQNDSFAFSGGESTLASGASSGASTITTSTAIPGYISYVTFADGSTYNIASASGTSITLNSPLTSSKTSGSKVWATSQAPIGKVASGAAQGAATVSVSNATTPFMQFASVAIGAQMYTLTSATGSGSSYTVGVGGLDSAVVANTPVFYGALAGNVTVSYLDINNDQHNTTGTFYTGAGWTISHNNIHDGYSTPGLGVAIYGGDEGVIEYNCISRMGNYGANIFGHNNKFRYNEVYRTNYKPDPGCGCSGGGKWWGTLNADIVGNAFVEDGPGGGQPIWLDNGNTGTNISGNYFSKSAGSAIHSETGFNLSVTNNLFQDGGWGDGTGEGDNNDGAVNINSSGGFHVPNSRYDNQIIVSGNQFINNWQGVTIWQSGARSCENSGEDWPYDANYCSGGFPVTAETGSGGQFYFSHTGDSLHQNGATDVTLPITAGSSTLQVKGALAINDQIGFTDPVRTNTSNTANVTSFTGSGTIAVTSTAGFPSSGQLRVGTSAAWDDAGGSYTGAILSYTGITATSFTGVNFVRGKGTLAGPVQQVQPYKVVSQTCYANDCVVTVSPSITSNVAAGTSVTNAGTCQLFATAAATPSSPAAPSGISYFEGCQWGTKNITISGNDFRFDPTAIASGTPIVGTGTSTTCTASHTNSCGTNFMAYQPAGEAPFGSYLGANAMMSHGATGCPSWDTGCSASPFVNLNALPAPPGGAPAGTGLAANNNIWSGNTYTGPWLWNTYVYGTCTTITDATTGKSSPGDACSADFTHWQSYWQQETGSTYTP